MKKVPTADLAEFLEAKFKTYNHPRFIESDPISIPHRFSLQQDIEIAAFLSATIAWGQRPVIIRNATRLMTLMDNSPYQFIRHFTSHELKVFKNFGHRTFQSADLVYFLKQLQKIYRQHDTLEKFFGQCAPDTPSSDLKDNITGWRTNFFSGTQPHRSKKHFANPASGSASKRMNMFLRWMIRKDKAGVDFGLWNFPPSLLTCPLDVHSARVARKLKLLKRKQTDWRAATELTNTLRNFDSSDPVKYDFALFGLGVFEKF